MGIGWTEILLIALVVLLVFGAKRIPEIAKALGRASFEFKKARAEIHKEAEDLIKETEKHAEAASKAGTPPTAQNQSDESKDTTGNDGSANA